MDTLVIFVAQYLIFIIAISFLGYSLLRVPKGERKVLLVSLLCALVIAAVLVKLAGAIHVSPRPFVLDHIPPLFPHIANNGFPSDHTVFGSILALLLLRYNRRLAIILFVLSLMVGLARVIANVHHLQDVVAAIIIAVLTVVLATLITDYTFAKLGTLKQGQGDK